MTNDDWAARVAAVWDESDELGDNILRERIDALVAERTADDPEAAFEGAAIAIGALAPHLPRYQRSMKNYALALFKEAR